MNLPLNIDWQQILLHLLNFVILAGGLWLLLYKPVKDFMEKRKAEYTKQDDESNKKLEYAEGLKSEYEGHIAQAEQDAELIRSKAAAEAELAAKAVVDAARLEGEKIIVESRAAAEKERLELINGTKAEIMQIAIDATQKILSGGSAEEMYDSFIKAQEEDNE